MLTNLIPLSAAIHAIGTMILAVMTRVSLGHTGRPLHADRATVIIYMLVIVAAVARIGAAFIMTLYMPLLELSAILWIAAFGTFLLRYAPFLLSARVSLYGSDCAQRWIISEGSMIEREGMRTPLARASG